MKKLKKVLKLSDPYPTLGYEISCYLKAALGLIFIIFGFFLLISPLLRKDLIVCGFGIILNPLGQAILVWEEQIFGRYFLLLSFILGVNFIALGLFLFWQIKLVRKLFKILF